MNYPLRETVKHTRLRKDDIKEEGNGGLLFRIAALGFASLIPAKQRSHTVQISVSSGRCWCAPDKLNRQRHAAKDAWAAVQPPVRRAVGSQQAAFLFLP